MNGPQNRRNNLQDYADRLARELEDMKANVKAVEGYDVGLWEADLDFDPTVIEALYPKG